MRLGKRPFSHFPPSEHLGSLGEHHFVVFNEGLEVGPHVGDFGQSFKDWDELVKFSAREVVVPRSRRDCALWVEHVGGGRVVDDDRVVQGPSKPR